MKKSNAGRSARTVKQLAEFLAEFPRLTVEALIESLLETAMICAKDDDDYRYTLACETRDRRPSTKGGAR